jgi:hypothetical protein
MCYQRHECPKRSHTFNLFQVLDGITVKNLYTNNINLKHTCIPSKVKKMETENFILFCKFKKDNPVKNQWTLTKFELDLRITITYLHMQFQSYTYIQTKVTERKLNISSRGIILSKYFWTMTKFTFDLRNLMMYPYTKLQ